MIPYLILLSLIILILLYYLFVFMSSSSLPLKSLVGNVKTNISNKTEWMNPIQKQ